MFDINELLINDDNFNLYKGGGFTNKLSTGILTLDIALGGGIPFNGALLHLFGAESAGKTSLAYRLCKKVTDNNGYVTWVDSETSYDPVWAQIQGLKPNLTLGYRPLCKEHCIKLILNDIKKYKSKFLPWLLDSKWQPTKEQAEEAKTGVRDIEGIKNYMIKNAPYHTIVWDSIAAAPLKAQIDEEAEFSQGMMFEARLHKTFLKMYASSVIGCDKINFIILNQVIDNVGSYAGGVTFTGGHSLAHMIHLNILVQKHGRGEQDNDGVTTTDYVTLKVIKNKITPVTMIAFPVIFSKSRGFIGITSLLEYLLSIDFFQGKGWKKFIYRKIDKETGEVLSEEEINFQYSKFYQLMLDRPELLEYLCEKVKEKFMERFPKTVSLTSSNIHDIVESCLNEENATPNEEELVDLNSLKQQ